MNKEILFRGKRKDNGEWIYGSLIEIDKKYYIYKYIYIGELVDSYEIEVIPETIRQYTGLCDKEGNKIFEGDIVYFQYYDGLTGETSEITITIETPYDLMGYGELDTMDLEIIGNIHDNPELTKEEE